MTEGTAVPADHNWGQFPNTVLRFDGDRRGLAIDLRLPLTSKAHKELLTLGLAPAFAIITAYNPLGVARPEVMNSARFARLCATLMSRGRWFVRVEAGSPDGSHIEPSVAITLEQDEAIALAREYDQLAIFWFDGERFWIIPAKSATPALALPVDAT